MDREGVRTGLHFYVPNDDSCPRTIFGNITLNTLSGSHHLWLNKVPEKKLDEVLLVCGRNEEKGGKMLHLQLMK